jgi:hypothetical protein
MMHRRGRVVIRSQGPSMQPSIPDGALLEIRPVVFDELEPGDVVVYHRASEVFCHRLIRKAGRACVLKGDALLAADPPVAWAQVLGRVTTVIAEGERFIPLDHPDERRRAWWRARMSYPHALWQRVSAAVRRLVRKEPQP